MHTKKRLALQKAALKKESTEKHGIDFFIDPPEEFLIKGKGLDAVKMIRALRD